MPTHQLKCVSLLFIILVASTVSAAEDLTLWVRENTSTLAARIVDHWNETHPADHITLTRIPHERMMSSFTDAVAAGNAPDLLSLDLILMPDYMKAGYLKDVTDQVAGNPNIKKLVPAHMHLATYKERFYGIPFTLDDSVLFYNKTLFRKAGFDPEKPPASSEEIVAVARKVRALGPEFYGFYFSGSSAGSNIFTVAPQMWAEHGTVVLPSGCEAEPLQGDSIEQVLQAYRTMWNEGLIPKDAKADLGEDHTMEVFRTGKIGMQAGPNYGVAVIKEKAPDLDFGVAFLPGPRRGEVSSFAGGDVLAIPAAAKHAAKAVEFLNWVLGDEPQLEVYAKSGNMPSRTDLAKNKYFAADARLSKTAEALSIAQTPWTFHFNEMASASSSPWLAMLQTAIFDGDIDGAIAKAKKQMKQIQCN